MSGMPKEVRHTVLRRAMGRCRGALIAVGLFSGLANVLQLTSSLYMLEVYDRILSSRSLDTLLYISLITAAALLLWAILEGARNAAVQRIGGWIEQVVGPETFARGIEARLRGMPYTMEGLRDLGVIRGFIGSPAALALYDAPWVPVYIAVIWLLHPTLGWLSAFGALALFILSLANEALTARLIKRTNAVSSAVHRRTESVARNAEVIDSMGMLPAIMRRWHETKSAALPDQLRAAGRANWVMAITRFCRVGLQVAVLGLGAVLVLRGEMTSGAMVAASIIMGRSLAPVEQMIGGWKQFVGARGAWKRLSAFLSAPSVRPPGAALPAPEGRLSLEHITYAFPGRSELAIKNMSFKLEPGTSLAIVGPSAAGKTTLIRLITGTLKPGTGAVRLDAADVFQWQREDFGRHLGYLPQDVELFEGTVFDNIARMGEAEPDDVYEAAKLAGCHEMILRLSKGYDTEIGDSGAQLSGGQRQMIGLARALFGNPKIVVLDEPNSNLDTDGETALANALEVLKSRKITVVLVSHRPGLVQKVDALMILRDGAIEAMGPRAEVLRRLVPPQQAPARLPEQASVSRLERMTH